jgi:hypothetical protein
MNNYYEVRHPTKKHRLGWAKKFGNKFYVYSKDNELVLTVSDKTENVPHLLRDVFLNSKEN